MKITEKARTKDALRQTVMSAITRIGNTSALYAIRAAV
jgi:hypothetical protein|tara:strand:+ start:3153 stop:3266 length:114 start_codon:yes stop_codon:yes gene_type:complete